MRSWLSRCTPLCAWFVRSQRACAHKARIRWWRKPLPSRANCATSKTAFPAVHCFDACAVVGCCTFALSCRWACYPLWIMAEIAIAACDLAEVIGAAVALQLLFGLPLWAGVLITIADVALVMLLEGRGFRWLEVFIIALILIIFAW